ncbi:MAG: tRNA pseudouridine(55) synthase TruB [Clostridiales bacterium]|nr:tRNA pseudouridine(55) synthase TruB [Candidatus Crickella equi]
MKIEGVININKPADWTSQDVCAKLRGKLQIKKIGHTGTLDPMATGVLPVCIGNACKIIEYYDHDHKSYHATMQLGLETDTLDITGETLSQHDFSSVGIEDVYAAFEAYKGNISQIPPKYSAVRINGQRAYDLARQGIDVNIKPREITIYNNKITSMNLNDGIIEFDVECSKGTYIRTMIDDIGRKLGCMATMTALVRTQSGNFKLCGSVDFFKLLEMPLEEIRPLVLPADETINHTGVVTVIDEKYRFVTHGNEILSKDYKVSKDCDFENAYRIYCKGEFIGIGKIMNRVLQPIKVVTEQE